MISKTHLATSCTALGLGLALVWNPQGAVAQEQQSATIEEVVVTGSRIRRSDIDSVTPITVLGEIELEQSGQMTLENFLQDLPSVGGGDFGSSVNNGNPGWATVSLRGLGPNRTLVLVNGQRPASVSTEGLVDLNLIPTAVVERVEVLRGGASTVYGSDAIAGVVNIITKRDFEGVEVEAGYDITAEGDGEKYLAALTLGHSFDRGHMVLNAQYTKRADIWQGDRSFSECALGESGGALECVGSGTTTPAAISPQDGPEASGQYIVDPVTGITRPFGNADTYNFAAASYMVTPQEVYSFYGDARYDIVQDNDFSTVSAFLTGTFANRESSQLMAAEGTFWGALVPASHPENPFGDDLCASNPECTTPQSVAISRRLAETGGRGYNQDATSWQVVFGLDGELFNGWNWDISYNYSQYQDAQRDTGKANTPRVDLMLDPAACSADPECLAATGGLGYWNPFASQTLTDAMQAYALVDPNEISRSNMADLQINLAGDFSEWFELPAGPLEWAVGYERRRESAEVLPDGAALLGQVYFVSGQVTRGDYDVKEYYGEVRVPILSGAPFAEVLAAELSFRSSDYSTVGSDTTARYALEWAPISDLRLRASFSEGFRAPNIGELFSPEQQTAAQYNEPCLNYGAAGTDPVIAANCAAEGLPPTFSLTSTQATGLLGGNTDLESETSETWTYGLVWTPSFIPDFSLVVDAYNIEIEGAVGSLGTDNIITGCYSSPNFSSPLCDLILGAPAVGASPRVMPAGATAPNFRDALNTVAGQVLTNQNLGTFETSGVDLTLRYGMDFDLGRLDLRFMGSYMDTYEYFPFPGGEATELAGYFGTDPYQGDSVSIFPEWKWNIGATFSTDVWGANYTLRYLGEVEDVNADAGNLENVADAQIYHDVQAYYEWNNITFTVGMINATDEEPPYVTNYDDMNTIHFNYDTAGAYYYTRLVASF